MAQDPAFEEVMARLRRGDEEAASQVFQRFAGRLIALARSRLDQRLRQKVDPEDVLQSAWRSFFLRHAEGQFELQSWDSLWSMLVVITLRKCGHQVEYFRAACRDLRREESPAVTDDSAPAWEALSGEPTPAQALLLAEAVEQVVGALSDERERQMVELSLQGYTPAEVSARMGRSERTVQRVLSRVRQRLERMRDRPAEES
jgi:RNA polymerase sigma-70 factor (ECF subfamily)